MNKLSFGLLVGTAVLSMMGCRGLIHPDADTSDLTGNEIPNENFHVLTFETDYTDQFGTAPDSTSNPLRSSTWDKFGDYSFTGTSGNIGGLTYDDVIGLENNFGYCSWCKFDGTFDNTVDTNSSIVQAVYYVSVDNNVTLFVYYSINTERVIVNLQEIYGSATIQNILIGLDVTTAEIKSGDHCIGAVVDYANLTLYLVYDGQVESASFSAFTVSGASAVANYLRINGSNAKVISSKTITLYQDDVLFAYDDACNPDLFVSHYLSNQAWNTTYSYADVLIKPASGGKIQLVGETEYYAPVSGEPSVGTLHLINTLPAVYNANPAEATTIEVDCSAYIPSGAKGVLLRTLYHRTSGNLLINFTASGTPSSTNVDDWIEDYGNTGYVSGTITTTIDSGGKFVFRTGGTGVLDLLQCRIIGYYI